MSIEDAILRVEHLQKYFPIEKSFLEKMFTRNRHFVKAVDNVSFAVRRGEIFTLAGESGCGKTTTGKLVEGYLRQLLGRYCLITLMLHL